MAKKPKIKPISELNGVALRKHRHFFMLNDKEKQSPRTLYLQI